MNWTKVMAPTVAITAREKAAVTKRLIVAATVSVWRFSKAAWSK